MTGFGDLSGIFLSEEAVTCSTVCINDFNPFLLLADVPTTWDKTLPLDSRLGEYITIAKRSGTDWYVGGMSSWTAHDVDVDFSFLNPTMNYIALVLRDGNNASTYPTRYIADTLIINSQTKMTFNMARGGGFVVRLREAFGLGMDKPEVTAGTSLTVNKDALWVRSNENISGIKIYALSGELLANYEFSGSSFFRQIALSGCNKGVYIAKIQKESTIDSLKFIY